MSRRYPIVFPRYMRPKDGVIKAELRAGVPWCPKHKQAAPLHHGLPHCRSCEIARIWDRALERVTTERDTLREDVDFFERGHFRAGSLAKVEQERDKVRAEIAAISEAIADYACKDEMPVQTCRILMDDLERARRERDQASSALAQAQAERDTALLGCDGARVRSGALAQENAALRTELLEAKNTLKTVIPATTFCGRCGANRFTPWYDLDSCSYICAACFRVISLAEGRRQGIEAAARELMWRAGTAMRDFAGVKEVAEAIRSLLSVPQATGDATKETNSCAHRYVHEVMRSRPEGPNRWIAMGEWRCLACYALVSPLQVSQDAAPATASPEPHHWRYEVPGLSGKFRCKVCGLLSDKPLIEPCHATKIGGDSLVARLRRIVAWFAIPEHRGTPCEEDLADITAAADALEGAESEVARRIAEAESV